MPHFSNCYPSSKYGCLHQPIDINSMTSTIQESDIKQLNTFLRGELSAVETYDQALSKAEDTGAKSVLRENKSSHAARVDTLRSEIQKLGGEPADSSGAWGAFAKAVQGGAKVFGESAAISALEEGEDHGLKMYKDDDIPPTLRTLVTHKLLPEQQRTHDAMSRLKELKA